VSRFRSRYEKLRAGPPSQGARLVFRKAIYRKVIVGRYEVRASDCRAPDTPLALRIDFLENPDFDVVMGTNPYLTEIDMERFRQQESVCVVVLDGSRLAASAWLTSGNVYLPELHRYVFVPRGEHYGCRTYVHDDYRGHALMSHMNHAYTQQISPNDIIWGSAYKWNFAAIRALENIGLRHTGDYWNRFVFGLKIPGECHFAPRLPTAAPRT
jgi:hypothetical protein